MFSKILEGIAHAQHLQDTEGHDHPEETQVYTFACSALVRFMLRLKRIRGLTFELYNSEWYGLYRAQK